MPPEEPAGTEQKSQLSPVLVSHRHLSELNPLHQGRRMEDHEQQKHSDHFRDFQAQWCAVDHSSPTFALRQDLKKGVNSTPWNPVKLKRRELLHYWQGDCGKGPAPDGKGRQRRGAEAHRRLPTSRKTFQHNCQQYSAPSVWLPRPACPSCRCGSQELAREKVLGDEGTNEQGRRQTHRHFGARHTRVTGERQKWEDWFMERNEHARWCLSARLPFSQRSFCLYDILKEEEVKISELEQIHFWKSRNYPPP